jgi:hypothetical protein
MGGESVLDRLIAGQMKFPAIYEPDGTLSCTQEPATVLCLEPWIMGSDYWGNIPAESRPKFKPTLTVGLAYRLQT